MMSHLHEHPEHGLLGKVPDDGAGSCIDRGKIGRRQRPTAFGLVFLRILLSFLLLPCDD